MLSCFITIQYTCLYTSRWPNPSPSLAPQLSLLLILQRSQIASHGADLSQRRLHPLHRLFLRNRVGVGVVVVVDALEDDDVEVEDGHAGDDAHQDEQVARRVRHLFK